MLSHPPQIGWTGSREITTEMQQWIEARLCDLDPRIRIITGGCVGVDAHVARIAHDLGLRVHTVLPAIEDQIDLEWQQHCQTHEQMPEGTDYRARNTRLVRLSDRLIAVPRYPELHPRSWRSGTWMTVRIARAEGVGITIWPGAQ